MMKKLTVIILICIAALTASYSISQRNSIIRIHILAESDSEEDQSTKLLVRDSVNEYLSPILSACKTKREAEAKINESLADIEQIAEATAQRDVCVTFDEEEYPERTYGDTVYPAGVYKSLIIRIGNGEGHNWWCVAFPPMCYTSVKTKPVYRSFIFSLLERLGII